MIERVCAGAQCDNTFEAYPSQNKRYCSPACRYTDPKLIKLLTINLRRHNLSEIDVENRHAVCSNCGPTRIRERKERGKFTDKPRWRCRTAEKARNWAKQYGVTAEEIFALLEDQGGKCRICGRLLEDDFHVDHDHTTGAVRGLLDAKCNTGLGLFGDDPERLREAAAYLERSRGK